MCYFSLDRKMIQYNTTILFDFCYVFNHWIDTTHTASYHNILYRKQKLKKKACWMTQQ